MWLALCGDGLGDAARGHQPHHAEHLERAVPLGAAALAVPVTLHPGFDHPRWYVRPLFVGAAACAAGAGDGLHQAIPSLDLRASPRRSTSVGLFARAACSATASSRACKPDPRYLTRFYLMLSLGGALGAVLVAIVAPLTLPGYFELGIALVALAVLVLEPAAGQAALGRRGGDRWSTAGFAVRGVVRIHRGRARDGARLLRRGAHRATTSSPVPYRSMYHGAHHARRPAARRLVPQHARPTTSARARATGACSPRCARCSRRSRSRSA